MNARAFIAATWPVWALAALLLSAALVCDRYARAQLARCLATPCPFGLTAEILDGQCWCVAPKGE